MSESPSLVEVYRFVKAQKNKTQKTIEKTVTYFVAWVQSMQVMPQEKEIQGYLWLTYDAALAQISFEQSQQLLVEANRVIQDWQDLNRT